MSKFKKHSPKFSEQWDSQFEQSAFVNRITMQYWFNRLKALAISSFEWKGFPSSVNTRFFENVLFERGWCVYFRDEALGDIVLPCLLNGEFNIYNIPKRRTAYATNGYTNSNLNEKNSVIIYNNVLHTNDVEVIQMFAWRLSKITRIMDVNVNAQKTPVMILATEEQRLTMKNLYMQYDGNQPFIYGDKSLDLGNIKALTTTAPFVSDKLRTELVSIWNEALTYLGIGNVNIEKKERLLTSEVEKSQSAVDSSRNARIYEREVACKEINAMFGTNGIVEYKDLGEMINIGTDGRKTEESEDEGNG